MKTIGLMGGSFNPAHKGHRAISLFAMDSLGLDAYWWMVSPGNPLKPKSDMAPLPARMASAKAHTKRTPIKVTAIEQALDLHAQRDLRHPRVGIEHRIATQPQLRAEDGLLEPQARQPQGGARAAGADRVLERHDA